MNINFEKLRKDLVDYFGTAMSFNPMAVINLSDVECASNEKLIDIAIKNGFNLGDYVK